MIGRLRILPCLIALAGLVTACGGAPGGGGSGGGGSGAANAAGASGSGAGSSGAAVVGSLASIHGACMQTTWKSQIQLTVDRAGKDTVLSATQLADPHPDVLAVDLTESGAVELKAVGGLEYIRKGTSKWFKVDLAMVPVTEQHPPCDEFTVLTDSGITGVQELGDQTAGSAHHYRFQGDAYTLYSVVPLEDLKTLPGFKDHPVQVSADLYTDASGRPLRYEIGTAEMNDGSGTVSMKLTENYSDFGIGVALTAPDPSQITDKLPAGITEIAPSSAAGA